jgi:pyruvate,water dikinase
MEFTVGVRWLNEIGREDAASCGFKGANLGALIGLGFHVPPGFIVPVTYFREHVERCGLLEALAPLIEAHDWGAVEETAVEALRASPLSEELQHELSHVWTRLGAAGVAVRSSATVEDLAGASFAGQYRTLLNIHGGEELHRAIRKCWASLWCREVLDYRERRSIDHTTGDMAVIVQAMFPADTAGVLFTNDPVSQRSDRILIEVVSGLGDALVSGTTGGAIFRVDRSTLEVVDRDGAAETLPLSQLEELCRVALEVEEHFGCPQDIEFALRDREVVLLQSRPITTLGRASPERLEPLGKATLADRMMKPLVAERYPIAPRPLDNLVYTRLVGAAIAGLRRSGAVVTAEDEATFRTEIWRQAYRFPPYRLTWRFLGSMWQTFRLLRTDWHQWWADGPGPTLRRETASVDLSALADGQLFERSEHLLAVWEEPLNERMFAASAFRAESVLRLLLTMAVGKNKSADTHAALLSGLQHPTLDANTALWSLSRLARKDPVVHAAIERLDPERLQSTPEGKDFLTKFGDFLDTFGHRETSCWYLSTPTWRVQPMQVWRLLRSVVSVEKPLADSTKTQSTYRKAREDVERQLRLLPGLPALFGWLLESLRSLTEFRELSHFDLTRVQAALQEIAAEWGRRLVARRVLIAVDDVFYLTHAEVRQWLLGNDVPTPEEAQRFLAKRRATYQLANTRWQKERYASIRTGSKLKGIATSSGTATGKARIIRGEHQFERLLPGEILVCPFTTPAWTPLFASAAAVVTETGGAASHAAIVAREYGIPAVMSVCGVMRALQDEDEILVDGDSGTVSINRRT